MITEFSKYYGEKKFWLVPTDERFVPSLKKLKCSKSFINYQSNNENIQLTKYVYVGVGNRVTGDDWSWSDYSEGGKKAFIDLNYKYMGTINIEDYEFKIDKYNL